MQCGGSKHPETQKREEHSDGGASEPAGRYTTKWVDVGQATWLAMGWGPAVRCHRHRRLPGCRPCMQGMAWRAQAGHFWSLLLQPLGRGMACWRPGGTGPGPGAWPDVVVVAGEGCYGTASDGHAPAVGSGRVGRGHPFKTARRGRGPARLRPRCQAAASWKRLLHVAQPVQVEVGVCMQVGGSQAKLSRAKLSRRH